MHGTLYACSPLLSITPLFTLGQSLNHGTILDILRHPRVASVNRFMFNHIIFDFFRFIAVMHADNDGIVPGNALVVDPKKQFRPLSKFGNAFLNRFQCSHTNSEVLKGNNKSTEILILAFNE